MISYMMTQGAAQHRGRQMGITAAPCLSPDSCMFCSSCLSFTFLSLFFSVRLRLPPSATGCEAWRKENKFNWIIYCKTSTSNLNFLGELSSRRIVDLRTLLIDWLGDSWRRSDLPDIRLRIQLDVVLRRSIRKLSDVKLEKVRVTSYNDCCVSWPDC